MLELADYVTSIGNGEFVEIKMNYKTHLASQYVTNKICEKLGSSIEVGFVYGGTVQTKNDNPYQLTTINLDSFHLPQKQKITPVTFDIPPENTYAIQRELQNENKRITGIAHSHGNLDVFHSGRDIQNYTVMSLSDGIKIKPVRNKEIMWKIKKYAHKAIKKVLRKKPTHPTYIIPTLVYNTNGEVATGIAAHNTQEFTHHDNVKINFYNKKQTLTIDEKRMLDRKIYHILKPLQKRRKLKGEENPNI